MNVILTLPPYVDKSIAEHPLVQGVRVNTIMPFQHSPREMLEQYATVKKPLWVDLKGRQLRVKEPAVPPFTSLRLSHKIQVPTPCLAYLGDQPHTVLKAHDDRIILEDGPRRLVGPGESVNIPHPQLKIDGYLTELDQSYLEAMRELRLSNLMLSFVERPTDLPEGFHTIAKLESAAGLDALRWLPPEVTPLVARGDLYTELNQCPAATLEACRRVIQQRPDAWVGSRLFSRFDLADYMDAALLHQMGFNTFLLGDELCLRKSSIEAALQQLQKLDRQLTTL